MAQPVHLDPAKHNHLKARRAPDLEASVGQQVMPVTVWEFSRAGNDCPVVFVKNADTGQFEAVMLLGLTQGENLMYQDGQWQGTYIPEALRMAPFRMLLDEANTEQGVLGLDLDSPLLSDTEGEPLFDDNGNATELVREAGQRLETYYQQRHATSAFLSLLVEKDLLSQQSLSMEFEGEKVQLDGIYLVKDQKVRDLPDDVALDFHRRGFLQAIYAHLMSLSQASRLARLKVTAQRKGGSILGA